MKTCVITEKWANPTISFHFPFLFSKGKFDHCLEGVGAGWNGHIHPILTPCVSLLRSHLWDGRVISAVMDTSINQEECSRRTSSPVLQERTETWAMWGHCNKALECPGMYIPTYLKISSALIGTKDVNSKTLGSPHPVHWVSTTSSLEQWEERKGFLCFPWMGRYGTFNPVQDLVSHLGQQPEAGVWVEGRRTKLVHGFGLTRRLQTTWSSAF